MKKLQLHKNSLFWNFAAALLGLFILLGLSYVLITAYAAREYYKETTQRLNASVAEHMLHEVTPFVNGEINEEALGKIMHSMMAVNPSIEVYLLNSEGDILKYVVLDKEVRLKSVDIAPVKKFVESKGEKYIQGDDPRNPGKQVVFSAAEVKVDDFMLGYVYMVLASEEYENISHALFASYFMRIGLWSFAFTLVSAFVLGLLLIAWLTRSLRKIQIGVRTFQAGDLHARIPVAGHGEMAELGRSFNSMADTILHNIEELKEIDVLRRDLIANVSHDLRSPMAVIHGYIETLALKEDQLSKIERQEYLDIILKSSEKLKRLVSDLFELSRLEARQIEIRKEPVFINEMLYEVTRQFELIAKAKNVRVKVNIPERMPTMFADSSMLNRVFQNLMDNAIKYSPDSGNIEVNAAMDGRDFKISFENDGVGIPENELPHIFDRYYIADHHKNENKGTGLGLAIVKRIIDLHSSQIKVFSGLNDRTKFELTLISIT